MVWNNAGKIPEEFRNILRKVLENTCKVPREVLDNSLRGSARKVHERNRKTPEDLRTVPGIAQTLGSDSITT